MKTWLIQQRFRVLYALHLDAWRTVREAYGLIRDFQGERTARNLLEVCDHLGLKAAVNAAGDLISFKAEAIEEAPLDSFFRDLAPFVSSGSRLIFFNQHALQTLYVFHEGAVSRYEKKMLYTPDEDAQFEEENL